MITLKNSYGRTVLVTVGGMKDVLLRPKNYRLEIGGDDIEGLELECLSAESLILLASRLREKGYRLSEIDLGLGSSESREVLKIDSPTVPLYGPNLRIFSLVRLEDLRNDIGRGFRILWFTKNSQAIIR